MSARGGSVWWLALLLCLSCGNVRKDKSTDEGKRVSEGASSTCTEYCADVMTACTGEQAVYVSDAACLAVCALLDAGDNDEPSGNTVACRHLYAVEAEREPETACRAAGPGGNSTCGSDCEAYCALFSRVCPDEAEEQGAELCIEQCGALAEQNSFDVVADHGGDTVECRLVHLTSASLNPAEHCRHAQLEPTQPWCVAEP